MKPQFTLGPGGSFADSWSDGEPLFQLLPTIQQPDEAHKSELGEGTQLRNGSPSHYVGICLPWVEYTYNSLVFTLSPFMASLGNNPPLFNHQEEEAAVLSV